MQRNFFPQDAYTRYSLSHSLDKLQDWKLMEHKVIAQMGEALTISTFPFLSVSLREPSIHQNWNGE